MGAIETPKLLKDTAGTPTIKRKASFGSTRSQRTRIDRSWHKKRWSFLQLTLRLRSKTSFTRCKYQSRRNKQNTIKFKY